MQYKRFVPRREAISKLATRRNLIIGGIILVVLIGGLYFLFGRGKNAESTETKKREVTVESVAALGSSTSPLPIIGNVHSVSEATLRTEKAGEVIGVYAKVGQFVSAGTIIAELEDAQERAAVAQADAAYRKALNGTRSEQLSILEINRNNAADALRGAEQSAATTLLSAYTTVDNAILQSADVTFANPRSETPRFNISTADSSLATSLSGERVSMNPILVRQDKAGQQTPAATALSGEISTTIGELQQVRKFLDDVVTALNKAIPNPVTTQTTIDTYRTSVTTARASVISAISALTTASDTIAAKRASLEVAEKNLSQGVTGNQPEDIAVAAAGLAAARATLEKSLIRTPISGTINTLALSRGDFVNPYQTAAVVSNNGALEIVGFVSDAERQLIDVGSKATIEDGIQGVVTSIAPGLDPDTKKAQIKIGVTGKATELTQGASVSVVVERKLTSKPTTDTNKPLLIPLVAIKIGATETTIFTVDQNGTLVPHAVTTGDIAGDKITVVSGLTPEMEIVTDARGLKAGDSVTVSSGAIVQ